jgi:hypothetical protein
MLIGLSQTFSLGSDFRKKSQNFMGSSNNNYMILYINSTVGVDERFSGKLTLVNNPTDCFIKATKNTYDLLAIFLEHGSFDDRDALVELCFKLKNNIHTMQIPLFFLFPSRHRKLLEHLQDAGVEYVMFYDPHDPNFKNHIENLLVNLPEECKIDKILYDICPHINYLPISRRKEILCCGAYRNRLVLGSYRLKNLCEISNHKICQYFKCPKPF